MRNLTFAPLAHFADVVMGQSPSTDLCNVEERGLPFLQGCAEFGLRHPDTDIYCSPPLRVAKNGSVLISVRAPVGTMNFADQDYCIGRGLGAFKAKVGLSNTVFIKHAVDLNCSYLHRRSQGSTFAAVSTDDVKSLPIPVFELAGQERIAHILSAADSAIERTEALIAKYQQIKAGLMHDLFTRGVLPNGQLRPPRSEAPELYHETAIGWIPNEWGVRRLDEVAQVARGKFTHRPRNDPAYLGGRFPFIQTSEITAAEGGMIANYSQTLSDLGRSVSQCFPAGTIAITIAANIADTALLAVPMYFPDSVVGAVVRPGVSHEFVELCIRRAKKVLDSRATQSAQKNINLQDLRPLLIPFPFCSEQDRIAELINSVRATLARESRVCEKLRAQKRGLMQDLLTGKVPVKVDMPEASHV